MLRRRANSETVEQIQPDLIVSTCKRKKQNPSLSSIYRALAEHEKRAAYPEAVTAAHADLAALQAAASNSGTGGGNRMDSVNLRGGPRRVINLSATSCTATSRRG